MRKKAKPVAGQSELAKAIDTVIETDKEIAFAHEYSLDWNKKRAAIRAGYSEDVAGSEGYRLANKPHIRALVLQLQTERAQHIKVDCNWALEQFVECYVAARSRGDLVASTKALVNIAKILGAYEKHNKQKQPQPLGQSEIDALKERLKSRGVDLDKVTARSVN